MHRLRPQRSGGMLQHLHPSADERCEMADMKDKVGVVGWGRRNSCCRYLTHEIMPLGRNENAGCAKMPREIIRRRMSFEQLQRGYASLPPVVRTNAQTESLALASGVLRSFMGADW